MRAHVKRSILFIYSLGAVGLLGAPCSWAQAKDLRPEPIHQTFILSVGDDPRTDDDKTTITDSDGRDVSAVKIGAMTVELADVRDELVISGTDKRGHPWTVYEPTERGVGYTALWTADLDGDGTQDLIFLDYFWVNGRCTDKALVTTILFDRDGIPSPARFSGFFNWDLDFDHNTGSGVLDLGNWDGNGHAELVQKDCYNYDYQNAHTDVYGLTDVYKAQNGVWKRLSNQQISRHQSTYDAVAKRGGRKLVARPRDHEPIPNYSNDRTGVSENRIVRFVDADCGTFPENAETKNLPVSPWREQNTHCDEHFDLADGESCVMTRDIVLFTPQETVVDLEGDSGGSRGPDDAKRWKGLLSRIIDEKLSVQLTGEVKPGCSPTTIWATRP